MAGTLEPLRPMERLASLLDPGRQRDTSVDAIKRRRALAEALSQQASDPNGAGGSMLGAIGQGLKGIAAARMRSQADEDERAGQQGLSDALARIAAGGGGTPALPAPPGMRPAAAGGLTRGTGGVPANIPSFVAAAGQPYGVSPTYMSTVAGIESGGRPDAANPSGAKGMFQFMPKTAKAYGLADPFDPAASADAAARLAADNRASLRRTLGRDPGDDELYLAHQQGAGGAGKLLSNPNALAADLVGRKAVIQNGGRADMTAGEFAGLWTSKYNQRAGTGRQAAADMPVADAQPVSFLTGPRDPNGGFYIPPAERALAPPGDPSGPRPGDEPPPSAMPPVSMQNFEERFNAAPPSAVPAPVSMQSFEERFNAAPPSAIDAGGTVPLPPPRPADAALFLPAEAPAPAGPSAPVGGPQATPLPPARPADAALYAPNPADLPAPGAVPAMGQVDPNASDAGAGAFARGNPLQGLQDGLDRIFGGPQTQARLDQDERRRQLQADALRGRSLLPGEGMTAASDVPVRSRVLAQALANPQDPSAAQPASSPSPSQEVYVRALDPSGAAGQGRAGISAQVPASAVSQPTAYAQAGGGADARRADLLALANSEYASPQIRQYALDQLNPKLSHVDMGDSLGFVDPSGNIVRSYQKTKAADFGEVGRDAYGQPIMGYRDYGQRSVSVPQVPGVAAAQAPTDMNGQPIPQGVDPKVVREQQSKSYVEGTIPASSSSVAELRKEVAQRPEFKNYAQAAPIYRSMVETAGRNTKASDLNLIYGLGKIMDPGSVVREGEMVMANNTQGIQERLNGMISSIQGGAMLTPQTRQALMAEAYGRMQSYETEYQGARGHYTDIAKRNRMNPDDVVQGFEPVKPWQVPQAGAGSAPGGAVDLLRSDPDAYRAQFDAKYGKGAADRALGRR